MQCSPAEPTQWLLPSGSFNKKPQRPGLQLEPSKCELVPLAPQADLSAFPPSFQVRRLACLTSWAPLSATLIIATLSLKRSGWRRRPNAWKLWLRCRTSGWAPTSSPLRFLHKNGAQHANHSSGAHASALAAFDQQHRGCLEHLGCFPVSDRTWHQATLGLKQGGLGLRQCTVHARQLTWHPWPPPMKLAGASMVGTRLIGLLLCRRRLRLMLPSLLPTVSMEFTNPAANLVGGLGQGPACSASGVGRRRIRAGTPSTSSTTGRRGVAAGPAFESPWASPGCCLFSRASPHAAPCSRRKL